jgi:transposase
MWVPEGKRPIVVATGSHQKTCVFGALCIDGRLKKLQSKFHKVIILFLDKAPQHYRSIKVRKHLEENKMNMKVEYFPKGSPEFNAVEECWRQGKDDLLISKYYPRLYNLKHAIANYYRIKRFKLDIANYLSRNIA